MLASHRDYLLAYAFCLDAVRNHYLDDHYQYRHKNYCTNNACNDHMQRIEFGRITFIITTLAHTEKRPEDCLHRRYKGDFALAGFFHVTHVLPFSLSGTAQPLSLIWPPTSKNV